MLSYEGKLPLYFTIKENCNYNKSFVIHPECTVQHTSEFYLYFKCKKFIQLYLSVK